MLGRMRSVSLSQEKIVLSDRDRFVLRLLAPPAGIYQRGQSSHARARRLHSGHSRRRDGASGDRARHRSGDRRDLRDVGRLDAPPRQCRRLDAARHADRISVRVVGGRAQRRADRLCRDPRALRDLGHGLVRSMASAATLSFRSTSFTCPPAPPASPGSAAALCSACRRRSCFSPLVALLGFRHPALHQAGAVHLRDRRQFRGRAHFGRAGASDHRPAIRDFRDDRLSSPA